MDDFEAFIDTLSQAHPGYTDFIAHLCTLAFAHLPPFIYITDANHPRVTASVVDAIFTQAAEVPYIPPLHYARINGVACFNARIFYDTVLDAFAGWQPSWENGCQTWPGEDGVRYNDSIDGFLHGLRRLSAELGAMQLPNSSKAKGKAKATEPSSQEPSLVIVVERAERLCENVPELVVPLTRLAELARVRVSVVLLSSVRWQDLQPPVGASPDPYFLDVESLARQDIIQRLVFAFRNTLEQISLSDVPDMTYHPSLLPLYEKYAEVLCSTIFLYVNDPVELQYIAAARWPGFVKPVVWQQENREGGDQVPDIQLPNMDGRLRLFNYFSPSFTQALEALYPRLTNAADWATQNDYEPGLGDMRPEGGDTSMKIRMPPTVKVDDLPRMSKFILVAAFLASTNPAKSDLRIFGRGAVDRKKKRRKAGISTKGGSNKTSAVTQRLLGPAVFPLDRLLAILGALLEEHDFESRPYDPRFELPGEYTDMEIGRIHVYGAITELTFMRALHRMNPMEKLDGPPTFKCGISYDVALALAKDVGVPSLNDLMWDPV
ncbi:hypothetical protein ID866_8184 [Astraeus odoratus]|nr:hypothetical protein ID866_8184 [Astraeus odoratus]